MNNNLKNKELFDELDNMFLWFRNEVKQFEDKVLYNKDKVLYSEDKVLYNKDDAFVYQYKQFIYHLKNNDMTKFLMFNHLSNIYLYLNIILNINKFDINVVKYFYSNRYKNFYYLLFKSYKITSTFISLNHKNIIDNNLTKNLILNLYDMINRKIFSLSKKNYTYKMEIVGQNIFNKNCSHKLCITL